MGGEVRVGMRGARKREGREPVFEAGDEAMETAAQFGSDREREGKGAELRESFV